MFWKKCVLLDKNSLEMSRLPEKSRIEILSLLQQPSMSVRKVAKKIGCSPTTVQSIKRKFAEHKLIKDLPRSGRRCKVSEETRTRLISTCQKHPKWTAREVLLNSTIDQTLSVSTVKRILARHRLNLLVAQKKSELIKALVGKHEDGEEEKEGNCTT
ncbi:unnamed protein product [Dimorphilus gyrociliatus]|uniref:Uncharacterized protein n=1 Tax=Dimorphilus gyrociliatus TaxID=2664684 RepID=A0A7I8VDR9_9ANNE|nr:unnamed protein product [Dimorphilus gyrociliatus]